MWNKHAACMAVLALTGLLDGTAVVSAQKPKIFAQKVVEDIKAAHPEITSLELAASRSKSGSCQTIAATEAKEIGQKCDKDELTAIRTNKPFIEEEKTGFDATMPIHDTGGEIIGTVGMDVAKEAGLTRAAVESRAARIVSEIEKRLTSREQLFRPAQ